MQKGKQYSLILIGAIVGMIAGFLYWKEVGCISGTCPITSNPVPSSLYGALMGGLLFSLFYKNKTENSNNQF
ncbi:MAG: hypothetical protein HOP37_03165 [Cyclobacteriaceae bacterium]|nr:hypothetical protein [Cyclobacteriaceae bacterium]